MRIAVIGAGIFGLTAAIELSRGGHEVTVFEREPQVMMAASMVNQYRLHRGYHYPRSAKTIEECVRTERSFREMFGEAVIDDPTYFCIAREGSLTTPEQYLEVLRSNGLSFDHAATPLVADDSIALCLQVPEGRINPMRLQKRINRLVKDAGVQVRCNTPVTVADLDAYDRIIVAAYAGINSALGADLPTPEYQFEVVEKPLVALPPEFAGQCVVVMDGPFMCIDPFGDSGYHLLGNVVHALHATNTGQHPEIPSELRGLLNRGFIKNPPVTKFRQFIGSGIPFVPQLARARHLGSMFAVRTVLPRRDATDERPTIVTRVNERVFTVFAGKLSNCVQAARDLAALV
jgi:hypothetical protein